MSGIAKGGYCGKSLVGQDVKSGKFYYYVCGTRNKNGSCSCQAFFTSKEKLEIVSVVEVRERLEAVIAELVNVNQRLERLYDALETGRLTIADPAPRIQSP